MEYRDSAPLISKSDSGLKAHLLPSSKLIYLRLNPILPLSLLPRIIPTNSVSIRCFIHRIYVQYMLTPSAHYHRSATLQPASLLKLQVDW
jgi:hypothetical protein